MPSVGGIRARRAAACASPALLGVLAAGASVAVLSPAGSTLAVSDVRGCAVALCIVMLRSGPGDGASIAIPPEGRSLYVADGSGIVASRTVGAG